MSGDGDLALFALEASRDFGARAAVALDLELSPHEERDFEDGEHKARPLVSVRGQDVYVIHSLYGDDAASGNDKLCRLLFFIGALKDAAAASVTAVVPYLCYARKDRRTKTRDPVTTRYLAQMFETVGTDRVVTLDVHNLAAFQNAFRCRTEHLEAVGLFVDYFVPLVGDRDLAVVSPDAGGAKRAERFRRALAEATGREPGGAFLEKHRSRGVVTGEAVVGEVEGRTAVIIDDLISGGGTMRRAAQACLQQGAAGVFAAATHGLFVGRAGEVVADPSLDRVVVTDSVPPFRLDRERIGDKLAVLDAASFVGRAIARMHAGGSVSELMPPPD